MSKYLLNKFLYTVDRDPELLDPVVARLARRRREPPGIADDLHCALPAVTIYRPARAFSLTFGMPYAA